MKLILNTENVVLVVENHGYDLFTPMNKSKVLFVAGLIGKKIDF